MGPGGQEVVHEPAMCTCGQEGKWYRDLYKEKHCQKIGGVVLPLCLALVRLHLEFSVQFWTLQYKRDMQLLEQVRQRAVGMIKGLEHLSYEEKPKEERLREDLANAYNYLKEGYQKDGVRLFSLVRGDRTRGNEYKLKYRKFQMDTRKSFFIVEVTEHWNRLPREAMKSLSLEILRSWLDTIPSNVL